MSATGWRASPRTPTSASISSDGAPCLTACGRTYRPDGRCEGRGMTITRRTVLAGGLALGAFPAFAQATPPTIDLRDPRLHRILDPAAPIETIASGIQWAEGPVWIRQGGYL